MGLPTVLSIVIYLLTLTLVIRRPRGLGIGWSALAGGFLTVAVGLVTPKDLPILRLLLGNLLFTLGGFLILSWILQYTGVFRWLSLYLVRWGQGSGKWLFVLVGLITAAISGVFSNYGAALMMTPVVIEMTQVLKFNPQTAFAFALATGFIADAASLPVTTSNLVNLITASSSQISFSRYAAIMIPVNLITILASLTTLLFYFWRQLPPTYSTPPKAFKPVLKKMPPPPPPFKYLEGDIITAATPPESQNTLFYQNFTWIHHPWVQVILFSWGICLIDMGLYNTGLTSFIRAILGQLTQWGFALSAIGTSFLAMGLAAIGNNVPAAFIETSAIQSIPFVAPTIRDAMVYASVIGGVVGAKITPIGSLSTLLWLSLLRHRGMPLSWSQYGRFSLIFTLPTLCVTILSLILWLPLFQS